MSHTLMRQTARLNFDWRLARYNCYSHCCSRPWGLECNWRSAGDRQESGSMWHGDPPSKASGRQEKNERDRHVSNECACVLLHQEPHGSSQRTILQGTTSERPNSTIFERLSLSLLSGCLRVSSLYCSISLSGAKMRSMCWRCKMLKMDMLRVLPSGTPSNSWRVYPDSCSNRGLHLRKRPSIDVTDDANGQQSNIHL